MRWFIIITFMLTACAPLNQSYRAKPKGPRNIIRTEEIIATSALNAYEAIRLLRPHLHLILVRRKDRMQPVEPIVYVNGSIYGGVESLKNIEASVIIDIKYLRPNSPEINMYGNYSGGVFVIMTR